jgi:uncharacterized repeat protein (TIGR03843 family)
MANKLKSGVFFEPVPFTDAAEWIRGKTPVTRAAWDAMIPELRGRAFLVTGIEDLNLLQEIRDIAAELPEGADYYALKDRIAGKLLQSPHFNEKSAARRAELILRHNGFAAYSAQDWRHMKETADTFPYWQYRTMGDEAVRESHAALHGLTLRHDDPFWLDHFPPWEWGCRCQVVNVGEEEFEEIKRLRTAGNFNPVFEEKTKGWTLPDEGLKVLHEQNILFDGGPNPKGVLVESKEMFKPGDLAIPPEELKNRYDPEDWASFEAKAKATDIGDGRTVWEWMNGAPAPAPRPVPQPAPRPAPRPAPQPAPPRAETPPPRAPEEVGTWAWSRFKGVREAIEKAKYKRKTPLGGGVNGSHILRNGKTVVFKPFAEERSATDLRQSAGIPDGTQGKREVAASIVDELLGTDLVPPTVEVEYRGQRGSAQLFVDGTERIWEVFDKQPARYAKKFRGSDALKRMGLLDSVIGNTDRHGGNALVDRQNRVWAIDHGLTFPSNADARLRIWEVEGKTIPPRQLDMLKRFLENFGEVERRLRGLLEPKAISAMKKRVETMLDPQTGGKYLE